MPAPPVPVSVSRRVCPSSARSSASSRSRPTNELASAGRPCGAVAGAKLGELVLELGCELRELVPPLLGPVVVAVLGKKLAAVDRERRPVGGRRPRAPRVGRGRLEPVDVDVRHEEERLVADDDRFRAERPTGDMHGLVEVVRRRARLAVAPEDVHRLLAVKPMALGEREQLDELACLLQAPRALGHRGAIDRGRKATQERDGDPRHPTEDARTGRGTTTPGLSGHPT